MAKKSGTLTQDKLRALNALEQGCGLTAVSLSLLLWRRRSERRAERLLATLAEQGFVREAACRIGNAARYEPTNAGFRVIGKRPF